MNPHRCKILCDKPFESSLCHRNDTTEHIATRRKAILPRRKVIRAMPSEPFVSTASYAVCPHPLRYGLPCHTRRPAPCLSALFQPCPTGRKSFLPPLPVQTSSSRPQRSEPEHRPEHRTPGPNRKRRPASEPHRPKYEHHPEPNAVPNTKHHPGHEKTCPKGARPSGQACAAW